MSRKDNRGILYSHCQHTKRTTFVNIYFKSSIKTNMRLRYFVCFKFLRFRKCLELNDLQVDAEKPCGEALFFVRFVNYRINSERVSLELNSDSFT